MQVLISTKKIVAENATTLILLTTFTALSANGVMFLLRKFRAVDCVDEDEVPLLS